MLSWIELDKILLRSCLDTEHE